VPTLFCQVQYWGRCMIACPQLSQLRACRAYGLQSQCHGQSLPLSLAVFHRALLRLMQACVQCCLGSLHHAGAGSVRGIDVRGALPELQLPCIMLGWRLLLSA